MTENEKQLKMMRIRVIKYIDDNYIYRDIMEDFRLFLLVHHNFVM